MATTHVNCVFDGATLSKLYAVDIVSQWDDVDFENFHDQERFSAGFIEGDILYLTEKVASPER